MAEKPPSWAPSSGQIGQVPLALSQDVDTTGVHPASGQDAHALAADIVKQQQSIINRFVAMQRQQIELGAKAIHKAVLSLPGMDAYYIHVQGLERMHYHINPQAEAPPPVPEPELPEVPELVVEEPVQPVFPEVPQIADLKFIVAGGFNTAKSATFGIIKSNGTLTPGVIAFTNMTAPSYAYPDHKTLIQGCIGAALDKAGNSILSASFLTDPGTAGSVSHPIPGPSLKRFSTSFGQTFQGIEETGHSGTSVVAVATDLSGNFFALWGMSINTGFMNVTKYSANGAMLWQITLALQPFQGVYYRYNYLAVDNDGNCYVTNSTFLKKLNGKNGAEIWTKVPDNINFPGGSLVTDNINHLYVVDYSVSGSNIARATKYTTDGKLIWQQTYPGHSSRGGAVSPDANNFYIATYGGLLKVSVTTGNIIWFRDLSSVNADGSENTHNYRSVAAMDDVVAVSQIFYFPSPSYGEGSYRYNEDHSILFLDPKTGADKYPSILWGTYMPLIDDDAVRDSVSTRAVIKQDANYGQIAALSRTPTDPPATLSPPPLKNP